MQLSVTRTALLVALDSAVRLVAKHGTMPILSNVLLETSDGRLVVRGTDLDRQVTIRAAATVDAGGAVTVPAHILHAFVRKLPDQADVSLKAEAGKGELTVSSGRTRMKLQTLPWNDYPDLSAGTFDHRFTLSGKALVRLVAKTKTCISTEATRHYLNGIYLHTIAVDGAVMLRAVATDGHRLAQVSTPAPEGAAGMPGIIVPRQTTAELERLGAAAGDTEVTIEVSAAKIRATYGVTTLVSKLIDGTFPDYTRVVPQANANRMVVDAAAFAETLERLAAVASTKNVAVKLDLEDDRARLSLRAADTANAGEEEIAVEWDHPPFAIGMNAGYALDLLATLAVERVAISFADAGSPMLLAEAREAEGGSQPNALYVLMPMKV